MYNNTPILDQGFRCSLSGAFFKSAVSTETDIQSNSFDAPYLELSLNPVHKYKYKFEIIDYICFDAPYLELSLNPEATANSI